MPAETKALAVYSGGRWVAAAGGGGGTVDTSNLVTKPEFVDAVKDLNARLAARYTKDEVDDLFAALPQQEPAAIELHDEAAPDFGPGLTPEGAVAVMAPYEDGLHWFTASSVLLLVSRKPLPNGEEVRIQSYSPAATAIGRLSSFVPPPGSVGTPPSWFVRQEGPVFFRLEAALPGDQFMPVGRGDVLESVAQQQFTEAVEKLNAEDARLDALAQAAGAISLNAVSAVRDELAALASNQQTFLTQSDLDQTNQQIQVLATVTQDCITGLDNKADKTTVSSLGTTLMNAIVEVREDSYTIIGVDSLLFDKADKTSTYTKTEVDAAIASAATGGTVDLAGYAKLNDIGQDITANVMKAQAFTFTKSNTTLGFTRFPEYPNGKLGIEIGGPGGDLQFVAYMSDLPTFTQAGLVAALAGQDVNVGNLSLQSNQITFGDESAIATGDGRVFFAANVSNPSTLSTVAFLSDLSGYAKQQDNTQNLLAKTVVAQAVGFGDSSNPTAALTYTDTGEGYGPRLVFAVGMVNDYVALRSDFEPISARVQAIEDRAVAPTNFDQNLYWRKDISDTRYMLKGEGMSKIDFDNHMALFLYSRAQIDAKLVAISPVGASTINDPALADFKQSLLDEVRKLMAGGKTIPADVPWTKLLNTGSTVAEAKLLNGVVYLRGVVTKAVAAGYIANVCQLPPTIPPPPGGEFVIPLAMKRTSPALRAFGYATFQPNRQIGVSCDSSSDTIWLDGISYPAYE
jgi:hypothetical protein